MVHFLNAKKQQISNYIGNLLLKFDIPHIKSIWFTGLSSAGKTTLGQLLADRLTKNGTPCMLIDGNEIRNLFDKRLGYDIASRRLQTQRVKKLAHWVEKNHILPIVTIIHPFEDDRAKLRREISGYFEVFLSCDIKECVKRDSKKVYLPAIEGSKKNVVGVDIPFDQPKHSDLILNSGNHSPLALLDQLWAAIQNWPNKSTSVNKAKSLSNNISCLE